MHQLNSRRRFAGYTWRAKVLAGRDVEVAVAAPGEFAELLLRSQVLEREQAQEVLLWLERRRDTDDLHMELVRRKWLTNYQAARLHDGDDRLVVGPYVLLELLGQGGMGRVYKARHRQLDRIVALKLLGVGTEGERRDRVRRFQREAKAGARLAHPNIVMLFDAGEVDGRHYLAMEYVCGLDLARLLILHGALPVPTACDYIRQAAEGMQHAHEQGLVHRDLKPSNLFLEIPEGMAGAAQLPTPGGRVKVLDLGLARVLPMKDHPSAALTRLSADGVVMGTPDYLAPEQALAAHGVDIRADIYSLGCTLFELLTGQPPFGEGSMTQKLLAHQHDPPPPLENFRTDAPWELAALLRRALAKKPADRFATPGALAAALTPFTRLSPLTPVVVRPSARTIVSTKRRMEAEERSGHDLLRPTLNTMVASVTAPPSSVADELAGFAAEPVVLTGHLGGVYCAAAGSDRRTAVTGGEDRLLVVWDLEAGTRVGLLRGHRDQIACASVSPDGRTAAAGDYDHAVVLWDLERGVEKFRLHGHSGPVATAVFTPDGRRLVTGGLDQAVQIWDVDDGKLVRGLGGLVTDRHWGPVLTAAITPSGELAMTAGRDRSIRLWDLQTGRQAACLLGHRHSIYCLAISPDGRRAASGGGDHSVCIWDIADGKKIGELEGHTRSVRSAAFLDEGRLLATGGDNTWRLWDVAAGRQLGCWAGNPETVLAVVPTGDGVLVVGNDRYVRYWRRSP